MRRSIVAIFVALAVAVPFVIAPNASAAKSRAGVVVVHSDRIEAECVRFNGTAIRGINLLNATSFDMYTNTFPGLGRGICWLDGEGHMPPACSDGGDMFWSQWVQQRKDAPVKFANDGPSTQKIRNGGIYYLQWGDFAQDAPDPVTLRSICNPDA